MKEERSHGFVELDLRDPRFEELDLVVDGCLLFSKRWKFVGRVGLKLDLIPLLRFRKMCGR